MSISPRLRVSSGQVLYDEVTKDILKILRVTTEVEAWSRRNRTKTLYSPDFFTRDRFERLPVGVLVSLDFRPFLFRPIKIHTVDGMDLEGVLTELTEHKVRVFGRTARVPVLLTLDQEREIDFSMIERIWSTKRERQLEEIEI